VSDSFDGGDVRLLALAVINQAINDAAGKISAEGDAALSFLTATVGPWAASFAAWCAVGDLELDWAREHVLAAVDMRKAALMSRKISGNAKSKGRRTNTYMAA